MPESETGGVKPMPIAGRMVRERERLFNMTDEERAWRKQWLKDQELAPDEPRYVPEYWKERTNPIRRFYQLPLNTLQKFLEPKIGAHPALVTRFWLGKGLMTVFGMFSMIYYFTYNTNDWTRGGGWRVHHSLERVVPGDPGFPRLSDRNNPDDYADRGFKSSVLYK